MSRRAGQREVTGRYARRIRILIVCTANQCRSPMAEALLRRRLADAAVEAEVSSAGLLAGGAPASGNAVRALSALGLDLAGHRSRTLRAGLVDDADLVLAMARVHLRQTLGPWPHAFNRSFTLKELVLRGGEAGPRPPHVPVPEWLAALAAERTWSDLLGDSAIHDVADPIGGPFRGYVATAAELDRLLSVLVGLLFPGPPNRPKEPIRDEIRG